MKEKFVSRAGFEPASPRNTSRKKNVINVKGELINMTRARNKEKNLILKFLVPRLSHMTWQFTFHLTAYILAEDYFAIDSCPVFPAFRLFWANENF